MKFWNGAFITVLSNNTVDDVVKSIISKYANPKLIVIASDFHIERVKIIVNEIFRYEDIEFTRQKTTYQVIKLK